ncbi:MAG TPA: UDP-3-O-(3-hydroxymyristoyl)glucosamine N-acyltransferase, partial [Candidatus Binatia bacterium]|nr:UDP-3-O-(3-hydroxymyristoyl)glucosamine N-acyltransferase [Candidatus Binatia bacterium]
IAFAKVLPLFFPDQAFAPGIHPTAIIPSSAQVHPTAHVGPYCVLADNVRIGAHSVLRGANHIGANCRLGSEVHLFPNVTLYADIDVGHRVRIHSGSVIGADGFGYVFDGGIHRKVPQIGKVILGDDVEIGANVTIDRGALGTTIIGKGTKIDNLVQIGHNVVVGENCLIVSQAGVAGSSKLGNYVVLAGQVGIAGHLKIGNRVTIGAQSGVMHDIPDGETWLWSPAQPDKQAKRQMLALPKLPDLLRRLRAVERKMGFKEVEGTAEKTDS